jgi:hypothetical protein
MVENHMNRKESKKKNQRERHERKDKMQMNLSTPTHKNM